MNRALIDTDILSYYFKGDDVVIHNFEKYLEFYDIIEISIITYYEIVSGLLAKKALRQLNIFVLFISQNLVLPLTEKSARISSELYSILRNEGNILDDIDLLISGVAIENNMVLITNNEAHFGRVPGLKIENWKKSVL